MPFMPDLARRRLAIGLAAAALAPLALAQPASYPDKPIRLIVPFAAGGPNDVMARVVAKQLTVDTGQPVVVENKPGAGGIIGTDAVAKAAPDGYTLGFISAPFTMTPALQPAMPYDVTRDLAPIAKVAESPMVMMVPATSAFGQARDLLDDARSHPDKITYGSGGIGSTPHLSTELLASLTGTRLLHVPYKGGGESIKALMAGEIDLLIDSVTSTGAAFASGRVKPLAIGLPQRAPNLPNVPTFAEAGLASYQVAHWVGIVVSAKTPAALQDRIHDRIAQALTSPEVVRKFEEMGARPVGGMRAEFGGFIQDELVKWQQLVKTARIQAQ